MVDIDDDFELDFQGFKDDDESDIDEEDEVLSFDFLPTYKTTRYLSPYKGHAFLLPLALTTWHTS